MARSRSDGLSVTKVVSHLFVMLLVSAVLGVVVSGLAIPFAGVLGFAARNVSDSIDELPQELETELLPQRTEILDSNGDPIATIYDQNRVIVPLRAISRIMVKSIVSIEDYRFYQHGALDVKGTLRALFTNQAADGVVQGGSSITQQLVKLTLLNQAERPRRSARRRPTTRTPASSASCATRSPWRRSTPRTGSWSATSTPPTSATAPTASRPPPSTTSTSTPRTSTCGSRRCSPASCRAPARSTRPRTPTGPASGATSSSTGWPS